MLQMSAMMGIKIPKVPQLVPMEKDKNPATTKMMAGISITGMLLWATKLLTYSPVLSKSRQTPLIVQASVKMMMAPVMDLTPSPMPSIKARKVMIFLGINRKKATIKAAKLDKANAGPASVLPKPSAMVMPPAK